MSNSGVRVIDFESIEPTVVPPFQNRSGGLGELFGGRLTRVVSRFDIMENIGDQAKPLEFGQRSLDP
ncbi:hypothetical protein [Tolypothrix sp. VBCCA 56010]|uniref:hypothetical protein n=1 Tax=Tolypothrix sp. VBCCA 56010 TaxID=3137731 RepID=UPI003D7EC557